MDKWQVDFNGMTYYLPVRGNIILLYIYIRTVYIYNIYILHGSFKCVRFFKPRNLGFHDPIFFGAVFKWMVFFKHLAWIYNIHQTFLTAFP